MNENKLSSKSILQNKKTKTKTLYVHDANAKGLYYKNMTKIEQDHDKFTYPNWC